jgi:hypothetical protein
VVQEVAEYRGKGFKSTEPKGRLRTGKELNKALNHGKAEKERLLIDIKVYLNSRKAGIWANLYCRAWP